MLTSSVPSMIFLRSMVISRTSRYSLFILASALEWLLKALL